MPGIFGKMFDFDNDGKLDAFEEAAEFDFFSQIMKEDEHEELREAGIDPEELEYMDSGSRREILENAGLNPDDFDF